MRTVSLVFLLVACTGATDATDSGTDSGTTGGDYDPWDGLVAQSTCEDYNGTPYAGATAYFVGDFAVDGDVIQGVEEWVLFANQGWQDSADAGRDCSMVWDIFGTIDSDPSNCVGCTHEVSVNATFNGEASDCIQPLEDMEGTDYQVTYYVQAASNGDATWTFPSGTVLGEGVLNSVQAAYASEYTCEIF